jgi:hypothetical protein
MISQHLNLFTLFSSLDRDLNVMFYTLLCFMSGITKTCGILSHVTSPLPMCYTELVLGLEVRGDGVPMLLPGSVPVQ